MFPAQPAKLVNLVAYQDGAVVSRTIVNKKTGTVTLFAFDEGEGLSEHTTPFDAVVFLLDGEADVSIAGAVHHLEAGEMILMPAGEPHGLKAVRKFKMMLTMIKARVRQTRPSRPRARPKSTFSSLRPLFRTSLNSDNY